MACMIGLWYVFPQLDLRGSVGRGIGRMITRSRNKMFMSGDLASTFLFLAGGESQPKLILSRS